MSGYVEQGEVVRNEQQALMCGLWMFTHKQAAEQGRTVCNVRVADSTAPLLRRPISYAGFDARKGTITLLYRVVGKGTEIMTRLVPGDTLDCLGPLGEPFVTSNNMLLVGGGVGIAPMLCIASHLQKMKKHKLFLVLEMKAKPSGLIYLKIRLFKSTSLLMMVAQVQKGFPTAIMPDLINANSFTSVMTCGPMPMMKGVAQVAKELNVPCQVSLEERMGCGTGGCLGCACDGAGGKRYKVCKDGPVFPAEEVFF